MYEFEDVNTADARYLFGIPILVTVVAVLPQLVLTSRVKTPLISQLAVVIAPIIVFIVVFAFGKMTTLIADGKIRLTWRFGFPTKEILISEIEAVETREISNWWGSGIKGTRKGMMWRAWGKTVVAILHNNGKIIFVGSDNPEELARAIRSALKN